MLRRLAETLAIGTAGGIAVNALGIPAGLVSGAMVAVAGASLVGRPMYVPRPLMHAILVLVGVSLGSVVTPETLHGVATYPLSIVVLIATMTVVGYLGATYLRLVHGWDRVSSYLAAAPGGLSQVMALAAELGADIRGVAIVQTMRVLLVAIGLPAGLAAFRLVGPSFRGVGVPFSFAMVGELAILFAASTTAAILFYRIRFPGGLLFGAMLTSAVLHGSGLIHAALPWWAANAAMIALGATTGALVSGMTPRLLVDFIVAAVGSLAVTVTVALGAAAALVALTPFRMADVMLAFAPGSVDAMMLLALALNIDPVYVGAHHLTRIFLVSVSMPLIARRAGKAERKTSSEKLSKTPPKQPPFDD